MCISSHLPTSVCVCVCVFLSLSLSLCGYVCLCVCVCVCMCVCMCMYVCLCVCVSYNSGSYQQFFKVFDFNGKVHSTVKYHDGFLGQRVCVCVYICAYLLLNDCTSVYTHTHTLTFTLHYTRTNHHLCAIWLYVSGNPRREQD